MTRKQMISTLRGMDFGTVIGSKGDEALRMAIAELEQEPSVTPSITRYIEKSNFSQEQYLLDTDTAYQCGYEKGKKDGRRKGHWITERDDYGEIQGWHCDKCYEDSGFTTDCKWHYCPNCGACMKDGRTLDEFIEDMRGDTE